MGLNKYKGIATTRFGCGEVGICHPSHHFLNCSSNNSPEQTSNIVTLDVVRRTHHTSAPIDRATPKTANTTLRATSAS